ncbi:Ribosome biogenesis protein brx1 [Auxenochlorella protothecoides]|uniref:Ribosome biogenesis protein brx1 n=1 Tax=Auxenochlorella protothecoides TaxID=3075 RepID=A0A087SMS9_AUXPR|nr:Ribosome biogenesis protein brx1 [Auxenochlorella protothecoides]KFM27033.1 Ribosome biogenesis protein brx1 [Auxenochlorella protothecoides]RMZ56371.1 hypothetical protein APUTEX25_004728 [Auxenochlorella protothecoides]|eukprot:RMZ56371.1 hypothetical protein APUTEX25_004728 [Auxenochlorella protothecoides]
MAKRKAREVAVSDPDVKQTENEPSTSEHGLDFKNKERVLIVTSRGITFRYRHLMLDMMQLLPHAKKDSKLDTKTERNLINEVAELKGCTTGMFFETRKHKDLYVWLGKTPAGPTAKFHVTNVHTMAELKLSGNHLKGSRPVLSFDATFDQEPHLQVLKEMLTQTFAVPRRHHKVKPFFDHVMSFTVADGRIWIRNYQVLPNPEKKKAAPGDVTLVEVGPRACLNPIKMFAGSFGGPVIYENPSFVSPNAIRAALKKQQSGKYGAKVDAREHRKQHVAANPLPRSELADVFQ